MKRSLNNVVFPALMMAWMILAVGVYALVSQYDFVHVFIIGLDLPKINLPAHLSIGKYLLDLLVAISGAGVFAACCMALGLLIVRPRPETQPSRLAIAAGAFLAGEIVFSIVFLTLIVLYRLTPLMVAVAFGLSLLAGGRNLVTFLSVPRLPHIPHELSKPDKLIWVLCAAVLLLGALYSSSVLGYDSVVDYFSQAKMLAMAQVPVHTLPNDPYLGSSFQSGILYSAMIQLFGDQAARLISWLNGLVVILLGLAIGEETGLTVRARLWFVALMATTTAYVDLLGDGKVELISTVPLLAAIYWLLSSLRNPDRRTFALIGLFLGFAMITRPYNIFLAPVFTVAFYGVHFLLRKRSGTLDMRPYLQNGLWMLPSLLLLGAFHLVQNQLWLGNPLAPVIAGTQLNPATWQWQFDPKLLNLFRLLYPVVATFANSPQSLGNVTPFVVAILPLLLLRRVRNALREWSGLLWLALVAGITMVIWLFAYFTVVEIRYLFFAWVLVFLVIAQLMDLAIERLKLRPAQLIRPLLIFTLVYMGVRISIISLGSYSPVDRRGQAHCYFLDMCNFMDPLNQVAAPGERVFVLNAYRYYLRPDLFACASRAQEYPALESLAKQESPEFWSELYRAGFRYVTYESNYATFHSYFGTLPPTSLSPDWLHVSILSSTGEGIYGSLAVYQLKTTHAPFQPETYCQRGTSGIWQLKRSSATGQE